MIRYVGTPSRGNPSQSESVARKGNASASEQEGFAGSGDADLGNCRQNLVARPEAMFSRMDNPDAKQERKPFRFQLKWLILFLALDAAFVAIGLWIVQGKGSDEHTVYLEEYELRLGAHVICPVLVNPKDELSDFPDSVWSGFEVDPLKIRLSDREDVKSAVFRLEAASSMPFSLTETLLRTMKSAGVVHLELVDSLGSVPVALRENRPFCSAGGRLVDCSPFLDNPAEKSTALFFARSDTLVLLVSGKGRSIVRSTVMERDGAGMEVLAHVRDSLRRWVSLMSPVDSVGILFQHRDPFHKVCEIARLVREAGGTSPWLAKRSPNMEQFLSEYLDGVSLEAAWRKDSLADSRGALLCGLERLFFRKQGVGGVLASAIQRDAGWMPTRLEDSIVIPECEGECHDMESYSYRDFSLPAMREEQNLVLREVQLRGFAMKTWSTWWTLYDNGRRTSVWAYEGGLAGEKELANYQIDTIVPLGRDGFRIQLKGESYRNGSWAEKGVELDFGWTENNFVLTTVCNRFGWFSGESFRTEERSGDGWTERSAENPPASLLRRCGYRDPGREGSPEFDWERNLRITRCITAWSEAKSTFRPLGVRSFIER
ncbi:MAG: hypothetical protein IPN71_08580 [Fibrobacteres bacterium]|nr:hypothetical protein [Fibrobacterota bacterium]